MAPLGAQARLLRRSAFRQPHAAALWALLFGFVDAAGLAALSTADGPSYVCRLEDQEITVLASSLYWPTWSPNAGDRPPLPTATLRTAREHLHRDLLGAVPGRASDAPTPRANEPFDYWKYLDPIANVFEDTARMPLPDTPPPA